jgi:DNA-binding NtrC family response regulator
MEFEFKLLVVDDDEELVEVITYYLQSAGITVESHVDPKKVLSAVETGNFAAILSDISMPSLDGMEMLAELRAKGYELPCIFLTGNFTMERMREALRLGAFDFLTKPFKREQLVTVVSRAMEVSRRERRLLALVDPSERSREKDLIQKLKLLAR